MNFHTKFVKNSDETMEKKNGEEHAKGCKDTCKWFLFPIENFVNEWFALAETKFLLSW